jgi:hypothetical protein
VISPLSGIPTVNPFYQNVAEPSKELLNHLNKT